MKEQKDPEKFGTAKASISAIAKHFLHPFSMIVLHSSNKFKQYIGLKRLHLNDIAIFITFLESYHHAFLYLFSYFIKQYPTTCIYIFSFCRVVHCSCCIHQRALSIKYFFLFFSAILFIMFILTPLYV